VGDIEFDAPIRDVDSGLPLFRGPEREVEIVFIDGAKSWPALLHALRVLAPRLAPAPLLIFQDFKDWASYWVGMCIGAIVEAEPAGTKRWASSRPSSGVGRSLLRATISSGHANGSSGIPAGAPRARGGPGSPPPRPAPEGSRRGPSRDSAR